MNENEAFLQNLRTTFRIEAEDHLKSLSSGLIALEKETDLDKKIQLVESLYREAHTLKGAARSVSIKSIQQVCQVLEDILALWKKQKLQESKALYDTCYSTLDFLTNALEKEPDQQAIDQMILKLERSKIPGISPSPDQKIAPQEKPVDRPHSTLDEKLIRVSLQKLENLLHEVEELLMVKQASQQEALSLRNLLNEITAKEKELAHLQQAQQKIHKALPSKCEESELIEFQKKLMKFTKDHLIKIAKTADLNAHVTGSIVDTVLEDIKKILMQPVTTLFDVFPRMIRDIANELKKEIKVEFEGGHIEVDRRILEVLKDPLIHLIRNAIDHGIEKPDERVAKGKNRNGTITVTATERGGSSVEISISDDGCGIDVEKIKEIATKQKLLTAKEAAELSTEDAIKLIFQSGFSTRSTITSLSGRGLGLGIISEKVEQLGGRIVVQSDKDRGVTFKLILPLTLATFRGIRIGIENLDFIVPAHHVKNVIRLKKGQIHTLENCQTISFDSHSLSYVHLSELFNIPQKSNKETIFALIIKGEEKLVAFGADVIYGESEVLIKNLGSQCVRVKNVMAATIMESGKVIPILNPIDLIGSALKMRPFLSTTRKSEKASSEKKTILLAEDSITTRLMMKNILESSGYEVKTAVDGVEALEVLQGNPVDLILTDIEMPNVDGFTLVEKIKGMEALKTLPIIICSARASREDREKGMILGANAYLDKSTFTQQSLLKLVEKFL